jgi:hypothetical protein
MYAGLKWLQRQGYIKYLPPKKNLHTVMRPDFKIGDQVAEGSPSDRKAALMLTLLDEVQQRKLGKDAHEVITPNGLGRRKMHVWGFSDDDYGNFSKAVSALSKEIHRWPNVKIVVKYTGHAHPTEKPHTVVLTPDGKTREQLPEERTEVTTIIGGWDGAG